ncbi:rhodanese-like domain-containing protein [Thiomicrorhabdus sp. zzn3]|uniref:rhodanese-like domain-containing protein n=1 Tax=Thiomicrorhabdus sp. zzn3 TaxID=3039775 RepID=UPI0024364E51|nr:rhodanese-like domain-containing protein [Thiomicrorhabdus sp. zzn3]MDG6777489.1 rhodanese-like domain-containing protein [Thiomicrorhabdus sp. zzn3]
MTALQAILMTVFCGLVLTPRAYPDPTDPTVETPKPGEVLITHDVREVSLQLQGQSWLIQRNQDPNVTLTPLFTNTTVGFLQPIQLAPSVETLGELEVLAWMRKMQTDDSIVLVDTRPFLPYERLHIPGAINIPPRLFKNEFAAIEVLERKLNVTTTDSGELNFNDAKTVIAYSNGHFCAMTPYAVKYAPYSLLKLGYPPEKIKYYRGGMQDWTSVGLTVAGADAF